MIILKRHLTALTFGAILAVTGQANAADPVKLGLINPIKTLIGKQNVEGAQLAVEMLNQDGGILGGRKIELVTYDTNFSPPEGVAAIQRLLTQDKV
ncbi:MAG: ABC transporter substrate-binding protein, partial [Chelatococcus sp.]|uniref:ABC transporter substrate-binding protein n=1 Tax=Chelatococcus sp. TaxID=1953771 RepID=UPI0025BBCC8C